MPYLVGYVTPQDYGATGNGVTDDTAAVQAALNALAGPVFFPPGTYLVSSAITVPSTAQLYGSGCGTYNTTPASPLTIIRLANGSNSNMLTIASGHAAGVIKDIQFDGNKANQTAGTGAIVFTSAAASEEAQWHLERVYVHDSYGDGITVQTNRQNNKFTECVVFNCGGYGIGISATDSAVINCTIGLNALDGVLASSVCHIHGSDIFSNRNGINVPSGVRGVQITNCGIDRNLQQGIYIAGSSVDVVACTLHSNSQTTTNTYSSISVDDTFGALDSVTIADCNFWQDGSITNKPKYHINNATATVLSQVSGCAFQASSYGTATFNRPLNSELSVPAIGVSTNAIVGATAPLGDNGVGEIQLANATTVPTTNPSGGTILYATSGGLFTRDPNGTVSAMVADPRTSMAMPGALAETVNRYEVTTASAPTSGTLYLQAVWLPAGTTVSKIGFGTGSTAATSPTHWWVALLDSSYKQQGHSADQLTAAIAASTWQNLSLAASYKATYTGTYYVALLVAATTTPTILQSGAGTPAAQFITGAGAPTPLMGGPSSTALTAPGTDGTTVYAAPTAAAAPFYLYCS